MNIRPEQYEQHAYRNNVNIGQYFGNQKQTTNKIYKKEFVFIDNRYATGVPSSNVDFVTQFNMNTGVDTTQETITDEHGNTRTVKYADSSVAIARNYTSFGTFRNVASVELKGISIEHTHNHK